ncbi:MULTISPECIES: hypothetical protein [Fischerella]|uniref:hypothetical protein n=1 Tax=Fischerella TaxID=1190 RepID=UPI000315C17F|nr:MULTISPECIES: hypothetical protein [Fischerella]MBD2432688.1 hypothetical protein [Fischerella sp. FACHB-380]
MIISDLNHIESADSSQITGGHWKGYYGRGKYYGGYYGFKGRGYKHYGHYKHKYW